MNKYVIRIHTTDEYHYSYDVESEIPKDSFLKNLVDKGWFINDEVAINLNQVTKIFIRNHDDREYDTDSIVQF